MKNIEKVSKHSRIPVDELSSNYGDDDTFFWRGPEEYEVHGDRVITIFELLRDENGL